MSNLLPLLENLLWAGLFLASSAAILGTISGFMGKAWWILDLTSPFRFHYFLVLLACALVFGFGGRQSAALVSGAFALVNFALILPLYLPRRPHNRSGRTFRAISANLLGSNQDYPAARDLVVNVDPDFFVFLETNHAWIEQMECLRSKYPFTISLPLEDNYGIAFFSRLPVESAEIHKFGPSKRATVIARLALDGKVLTVIGTHPPPPKSRSETVERDLQLTEIANYASQQETPVMVMGDFNLSSWSPAFGELLKLSGLRDSRPGFGVQPSWPVDNPLLRVPIDHILVSPQIDVLKRRTGQKIGSDHLPVILDFSIRE